MQSNREKNNATREAKGAEERVRNQAGGSFAGLVLGVMERWKSDRTVV